MKRQKVSTTKKLNLFRFTKVTISNFETNKLKGGSTSEAASIDGTETMLKC